MCAIKTFRQYLVLEEGVGEREKMEALEKAPHKCDALCRSLCQLMLKSTAGIPGKKI